MVRGALPDIYWACCNPLATALLTLLGRGLFLGRISEENIAPYGAKTVVAGVASTLISVLPGRHWIFDIALNNAMICPAGAGWESVPAM